MTPEYHLEFTPAFDKTLDEVVFHLCKYSERELVIQKLKKVIGHFSEHVKHDPYIYSVCRQALTLGINKYREYSKDNIRLIYAVNEDLHLVTVYLIAGQKQELCSLLQDYVLIH
jgi:mRNA-degrading endonuclease RelE of RelBE toxin-antitoxin system